MKKGVIIGIIAAAVIVAGFVSLSIFNNSHTTENSETGNNATISSAPKHYTVNLEEKVGVKTPP